MKIKKHQLSITVLALLNSILVFCQNGNLTLESKGQNLYKEISKMDSILFSAFNSGDIEKYSSLISEDMEFYHDKNGLIDTKERVVESFKKMVEAKEYGSSTITRELMDNTTEIYEIPGYGAIQIAEHNFYETSRKEKTKLATKAKFIHLWTNKNGKWEVNKVISYKHEPIKEKLNPDQPIIQLSEEVIDSYLGVYQFSPKFSLTITSEGNKIFGMAQGDKIEIQPYEKHKFLVKTDNSKIEFLLGVDGAINGLIMIGKNGEMKAKKIK